MTSAVLLHALNIVKRDGSTIYSAGNIGKDPTLISGYVSAFSSMEKEFIITNKNNEKKISSQFHRIGDVLMIIVGDDELITYGIFGEVSVEKIDELTEIIYEIHKIFEKNVWSKLEEDKKDIGIVTPEIIGSFENELFSFFTSKKFRDIVALSPLFLNSETGYYAVLWYMNSVYRKISKSLGSNAFWAILHRIKKILRLDIDPDLIIKFKEKEIELIKPKEMSAENFIGILSELIYELMVNIQEKFGRRILEELIVFGGIKYRF